MADFGSVSQGIVQNVERVVIGKRPQIRAALAAILARGHVLLEDVPGVAKTMLARSLAVTFGCEFRRVQCTPDLLPTDVTGVSVFNQKSLEFEFRPGPVFTNILLADEINRATPRTQSSLLEAMEERQVTVDGVTHALPKPFIVLATQNPIDQEGTFPLPEAQLDRFLVKLSLGYPDPAQEADMLERQKQRHPLEDLKPVVNAKAVAKMQEYVTRIFVHEDVKRYLLTLVQKTRVSLKLALGASPRASIALYRASQAAAALSGRNYVIPEDVKELAVPVLAHRVLLKPEYRLRRESTRSVIEEYLAEVEVPTSVKGQGATGTPDSLGLQSGTSAISSVDW
jgi:MoxR-like ATPase